MARANWATGCPSSAIGLYQFAISSSVADLPSSPHAHGTDLQTCRLVSLIVGMPQHVHCLEQLPAMKKNHAQVVLGIGITVVRGTPQPPSRHPLGLPGDPFPSESEASFGTGGCSSLTLLHCCVFRSVERWRIRSRLAVPAAMAGSGRDPTAGNGSRSAPPVRVRIRPALAAGAQGAYRVRQPPYSPSTSHSLINRLQEELPAFPLEACKARPFAPSPPASRRCTGRRCPAWWTAPAG